jgi:hypothetical protein
MCGPFIVIGSLLYWPIQYTYPLLVDVAVGPFVRYTSCVVNRDARVHSEWGSDPEPDRTGPGVQFRRILIFE